MKLGELLMRLQTIKAEHGPDIEVIVEANYEVNSDEHADDDNNIVCDFFMQASIEKVEAEFRCAEEPAVHIGLTDISIDD